MEQRTNKIALIAIIVAIITTGMFAMAANGYRPFSKSPINDANTFCKSHPGHHGNQGPSVEEKTVYTCPMHPKIVSEQPGKCPICGMDLVKVEKKSEGSPQSTDGVTANPSCACCAHRNNE